MRRRDFIAGIGGVAALPFSASAQQGMPVVGMIYSGSAASITKGMVAFRQGLSEMGLVEGRNVQIVERTADNQLDRLPGLVAELIQRPVAVIVANTPPALAAKRATSTIPIVFALANDPVADGLAASYNRPGGNATGVGFVSAQLGSKRLALLRQVAPNAATIGVVMNPEMSATVADEKDVHAAAQAMGQKIELIEVKTEQDLEPAFTLLAQHGAGAVLVGGGPFMFSNRERTVALAARHKLPASYALREYAEAGGLMSYGNSMVAAWRQAGVYAGRILKGENPAEMPVMQSNTFEFVLNLKTAKTLGIEIHPQLLATADEVIE